jgi:hypothetical protein
VAVALRVCAEELECLLLVDSVDGRQDAFCAFDDRAPAEGAFEVVVLGEAAQDDVECRLELVHFAVDEVGEDAALGCFVDEVWVFDVEWEDHGQAASWTICSISSSVWAELSPRPTSATSGCSRRVSSPTFSTSSSSATTSCPSERAIWETARFIVARNHENPEAESVIEQNSRFAIVETYAGAASRIARESDPRSQQTMRRKAEKQERSDRPPRREVPR